MSTPEGIAVAVEVGIEATGPAGLQVLLVAGGGDVWLTVEDARAVAGLLSRAVALADELPMPTLLTDLDGAW